MIIDNSFSLHKRCRVIDGASVFYLALSVVAMCLGIIYYYSRLPISYAQTKISTVTQVKESSHSRYHFGSESDMPFVPLPSIYEKVQFLESNTRPDAPPHRGSFLFCFAGGKERYLTEEGGRIYLDWREGQLRASKTKTPLFMESKLLDDNHLQVALHLRYEGSEGEEICHIASSHVVEKRGQKQEKPKSEVFKAILAQMDKVKIYPSDKLIDLYGGANFQEIRNLPRFDYFGTGKDLFFITSGLQFVFEEGRFVEKNENTVKKPLLVIKAVDKQKCEMTLWDEEGLFSRNYVFPIEKGVQVPTKTADLFMKIHQRSDTSVTCYVENKNMILKKGDWLLKTKAGWRHLYSEGELKDYLKYVLKGELFVFEGIEKNEGTSIFTGHLFDEKRTSMQKVDLPFSGKKSKPGKKNKPLSGAKDPVG